MTSRAMQAKRLPPGLKRAIDNYCDGLLDTERCEFDSEPYKVAMKNCDERWNEVLIEYGIASRTADPEGWIAVNERVPEGEDAVTCEAWCTGDEGLPPGPLIVQFDPDEEPSMQWQSREDTGCWTIGEVTHWRPRPKGPRGVKGDRK